MRGLAVQVTGGAARGGSGWRCQSGALAAPVVHSGGADSRIPHQRGRRGGQGDAHPRRWRRVSRARQRKDDLPTEQRGGHRVASGACVRSLRRTARVWFPRFWSPGRTLFTPCTHACRARVCTRTAEPVARSCTSRCLWPLITCLHVPVQPHHTTPHHIGTDGIRQADVVLRLARHLQDRNHQ